MFMQNVKRIIFNIKSLIGLKLFRKLHKRVAYITQTTDLQQSDFRAYVMYVLYTG